MRIGVLYNIVKNAASDENKLVLLASPIYNNQAYVIKNFGKLSEALDELKKHNLILVDIPESVDALLSDNLRRNTLEVDSVSYNSLLSYVNSVNSTLPIVMKVLGEFTPQQDEYAFNVRVPDNLKTINDFTKFNDRIAKIFQKFGVSKDDILVTGFAAGSKWYEFILENADWIVPTIISCIQLALDVLHYKKDAKNSDEVKTAVTIINNNYAADNQKITESAYIEQLVEEKVKVGVEERLRELGGSIGGKEQEESATMLVQATTELIKELDKGTEFHLSLNPPDFVKTDGQKTSFSIDYSSIPRPQELTNSDETQNIELPAGSEASDSSNQ